MLGKRYEALGRGGAGPKSDEPHTTVTALRRKTRNRLEADDPPERRRRQRDKWTPSVMGRLAIGDSCLIPYDLAVGPPAPCPYTAIIDRVERGLVPAQCDVSDRPTTTLAFAQSLDGSISGKFGTRAQLSNVQSQTMTPHLRALHSGILVGINTVLVDDPRLTVRLIKGPSPRPIVLDSSLRCPPCALMMNGDGGRPLIATTVRASAEREDRLRSAGAEVIRLPADKFGRVDLVALLSCLPDLNIRSLMVEGGAEVITSFLLARLADRLVVTICPMFLGGIPAINSSAQDHPSSLPSLDEPEYALCGGDLIVCANVSKRGAR